MENCSFTCPEWTCKIFIFSCINVLISGRAAGFFCEWRPKLRTLLVYDPQNILGRRYPLLAKNITDTFPSIDIILQYAQPLTSWTMDQIPDTKSWRLRRPCLAEITSLCEKYFSWGSSGDIVSRFKETL